MNVMKPALHLLLGNLLLCTGLFADGTDANLKKELSELKSKVAKLEEEKDSSGFADQIKVSGMIDSIYSYNFDNPASNTNTARVFDHEENSFNLNAAEVVIQKELSEDSPVGFRTDLYFGNDAELIHSAGLGDSSDTFDLEQAYIVFNVGSSKASESLNDFNVKVGKFVTMMGAEVIESRDNWNTSRSLLFGYAIPFTHTGARATYNFDNGNDLILGVVNGWDVTDDNNDGKSLEAHYGINGIDLGNDSSLYLTFQGMYGPEAADDNSSKRTLGDFIATYKTPWKPLTLMYNYDYATQENLAADGGSAEWSGHALYARLDLAEDWALSLRGEYFDDKDGVRIVSGTPADYRELTATLEYRPYENFISRLELRTDKASEDVYDDDGEASDSQNTISAEVIYSF